MESKPVFNLDKRMVQNFLDILILKHLKSNDTASGYDVIRFLHKRFRMLASPGTVYSVLYSLERKKLIEGNMDQGKRSYKLTVEGERFLEEIFDAKNYIQGVFSAIFFEN